MKNLLSTESANPVSIVAVDFIDGNENSEQKDKQNTLLSSCISTANNYESTISQDNNHQAQFKWTQEKQRKWVSVINWQNQMTHATNYINFSTITKFGNIVKRHSTKLRLYVITQWAMTNHMLFHLHYTTGAQYTYIEILSKYRHTRRLSSALTACR